ncbi:hypothetical protein IL38_15125 [Actinopolyspora erythraea]|uniref:Uncharacterized protein n=2 Tax=Actinopolyspora erythraea TaxID=414996 RepID=A0ABR4X225_9ACTN|nr:hypothetical protein IL38_15125 [Actinopolyspora erythraea]
MRRFLRPAGGSARPGQAPGTTCEMCSEPLWESGHSHVADVTSRRILCTCRACYLLFTHPGAGGGKHRAVPERYRYAPSFPAGAALWESTGIPVGMAFLFRSSLTGPVLFYPSPAGATESTLPRRDWDELVAGPAFADIAEDVEALLVNQLDGSGTEFEGFLVPVDTCYELVGLVRTHWRGFDGGSRARERIEEFFAGLRARAERVGSESRDG